LIGDKVEKGESSVVLSTIISEATLDIIGLVGKKKLHNVFSFDNMDFSNFKKYFLGFGHSFNTLTSPSELARAYAASFSNLAMFNFIIGVLGNYVPFIRKLPLAANKRFDNILKVVERESQKIIDEKYEADKNNKLGENDLLSALININKTLPAEEKMTDQELKYQVAKEIYNI
jgi:hypothetical protein